MGRRPSEPTAGLPEGCVSWFSCRAAVSRGGDIRRGDPQLETGLRNLAEGMDRAGLLLGSRPIDQFKAASGFNVAVDDLGSAAVVLVGGQAKALNEECNPAAIGMAARNRFEVTGFRALVDLSGDRFDTIRKGHAAQRILRGHRGVPRILAGQDRAASVNPS